MIAETKPGSARMSFARLMARAATVGLPAGGALLMFAGASVARADQPVSFAASSVPLAAAVATSTMLSADSMDIALPAATFETIGSGKASYYGRELAGNRTASGERFDPSGLTAAHRTLPLGSKVRVTNPKTGASVIVRINDRGPFHGNRLIDLSEAAASQIGIRSAGSGMVELAIPSD